MSDAPLVSILVTCYNHAPFVEQALDSALTQDFDDYEVVITDDASTDDSVAVIRGWLDRTGASASFVANERNLGVCATRNQALARSHGLFVCCLAADDWFEPDRLSMQVPFFLDQDEDVAAVYSDVRIVDQDGVLVRPSYLASSFPDTPPLEGWIFDDLHQSCFLTPLGVLVRRSTIDAVGGYDETLAFEDWDMWLRLADRYRFRYVPGVVATRRELPSSLYHSGFGTPRVQRSVARLHEKWLRRDEVAARHSAYWMRRAALTIALEDRAEARALLLKAQAASPSESRYWPALTAALAVPGAGRLLPAARRVTGRARALLEAERGAWRSGRRGRLASRVVARGTVRA